MHQTAAISIHVLSTTLKGCLLLLKCNKDYSKSNYDMITMFGVYYRISKLFVFLITFWIVCFLHHIYIYILIS